MTPLWANTFASFTAFNSTLAFLTGTLVLSFDWSFMTVSYTEVWMGVVDFYRLGGAFFSSFFAIFGGVASLTISSTPSSLLTSMTPLAGATVIRFTTLSITFTFTFVRLAETAPLSLV